MAASVNGISVENIEAMHRNGHESGSRKRSLDAGQLFQKLPEAAERIGRHLGAATIALILIDEFWSTRRALRAGGRLQHGAVACRAEDAIENGDLVACDGVQELENAILGLNCGIGDALKIIEEYVEPDSFEFGATFIEQAKLADAIAYGLEVTVTYPPRVELEDLFACARRVLSILNHNITRSEEEGTDDEE